MNPVAERIYRDTYERHVARLRSYIEADGICNAIGALIDAIELESSIEEQPECKIFKNYGFAIEILDLVKSALDIDYETATEIDKQINIDKLIKSLNNI